MRVLLAFLVLFLCLRVPAPASAQVCTDDYLTVETIKGRIIEIAPAPEPFKTADIYIEGPVRCMRMWMQVMKTDAGRCRIGDHVEAKGVVTEDAENKSWQINPVKNEYMTLGEDFTCTR